MRPFNEGQQIAHDTLIRYITGQDKDHRMWLLKGPAGTGKTYTISGILESAMKPRENRYGDISYGPSVAVTAPTHKAVQVLRKMQSLGTDVHYATIHSLLGLKEWIDPHTGKQSFKQDNDKTKELRIDQFDLVIVDEVSMLSNELFVLLNAQVVSKGLRLIMMGDPVQIPPVNEADPIPFKEDGRAQYRIGMVELTQVMRQAGGNPILNYAIRIRDAYKTRDVAPITEVNEKGEGVEVLQGTDGRIMDILRENFTSPEFGADSDRMKIIGWTNKVVDRYNQIVRKMIYKEEDLPRVVKGEKLIADSPVMDPTGMTGRIILTTNQEITVEDIEISYKSIEFPLKSTAHSTEDAGLFFGDDTVYSKSFMFYKTRVSTEFLTPDGNIGIKELEVHILHEGAADLFDRELDDMKKAILNMKPESRGSWWASWYKIQQNFAKVKYNYAITAHKSQGSTYHTVLSLEWDMNNNKQYRGITDSKREERNRIKYVAATRPKHKLYIAI